MKSITAWAIVGRARRSTVQDNADGQLLIFWIKTEAEKWYEANREERIVKVKITEVSR